MTYHPQPLDTSEVELLKELIGLTERLAENTHTSGPGSGSPRVGNSAQKER